MADSQRRLRHVPLVAREQALRYLRSKRVQHPLPGIPVLQLQPWIGDRRRLPALRGAGGASSSGASPIASTASTRLRSSRHVARPVVALQAPP